MKLTKVSNHKLSSQSKLNLMDRKSSNYMQNSNLLNQSNEDMVSFKSNAGMLSTTKSKASKLLLGLFTGIVGCTDNSLTKIEWVGQWQNARMLVRDESFATGKNIDKLVCKKYSDLCDYFKKPEYREALEESDQQQIETLNNYIEGIAQDNARKAEQDQQDFNNIANKFHQDLEDSYQRQIIDQQTQDADNLINAANRINNGN